jgi:hypothetical protein
MPMELLIPSRTGLYNEGTSMRSSKQRRVSHRVWLTVTSVPPEVTEYPKTTMPMELIMMNPRPTKPINLAKHYNILSLWRFTSCLSSV